MRLVILLACADKRIDPLLIPLRHGVASLRNVAGSIPANGSHSRVGHTIHVNDDTVTITKH
jgi:hypothetical protein